MDYEKAFLDLYDHYELAISNGEIHGDDFDRVDSILSVVWKLEEPDTIYGIFAGLDSDSDKAQFLEDFKNAVQEANGTSEESDEKLADLVILDRSK
jgi:hypothetical protein